MAIAGTFVPGGAGRILLVTHELDTASKRAVLVVPAFAEEMNKSRRLVWETGEALAAHGFMAVVPDLHGTGDSEGEFADARWETWIDDLRLTVEWARARGVEKFSALLVRLGAALFAAAAESLGVVFDRAVAWHPPRSGAEVLRQLLRVKIMVVRMSGGRAEPLEALERSLLTAREPMELGGYAVSAELAAAVKEAGFPADCASAVTDGLILDFAAPGQAGSAEQLPSRGWQTRRIAAERFWAAVEPRSDAGLVRATVDFLVAEP